MADALVHAAHMRQYHRRTVLHVAGAAAAAAAGSALLAACGAQSVPTPTGVVPPTPQPTAVATGAAVAAPTTAAATAVPTTASAMAPATAGGGASPPATMSGAAPMAAIDGKLPSPLPGVPDAYTKLPQPFKTVNAIPGKGSKVTAFLIAYNPPVPPRSDNKYWQELEKRLGVTWEPTLQPADGYPEKITALTAGGDLPDFVFIVYAQALSQFKLIQQGAYTDLTPYLTGDALKNYPNLAAIPGFIWKNLTFNGKIWGVPKPEAPGGGQVSWRQDWAEKVGIPNPKNADEFYNCMLAMTKMDPDKTGKKTWGMGSYAQGLFNMGLFQYMFRVPNLWRQNADGSLTYYIETDEFKQAVTYARKFWDAGIFHPDTATMSRTQRQDFIVNGTVGAVINAMTSFAGAGGWRDLARKFNPTANITTLVPMGFDGGKAATWLSRGIFGFAAIPAKVGKDPERVKELLRVADYFAAPFGSEEHTFLNYGLEGTHFTTQADGTRVVTDLGKKELGSAGGSDLATVCQPAVTYYYTVPGDAQEAQNVSRDITALGVANPCLTLYSPTDAAKGGELDQLRIDRVGSLIVGRDPLTALDTYIKDWRSRGGDQIRKEYQDALKGQ